MKPVLVAILSAVILGVVGTSLIIWPSVITEFYRNQYKSHQYVRTLFPIGRAFVESRYYETHLRIAGVVALVMAAIILFIMIRGLAQGG
jgi:hypothetical protein